jgi:hypothetical protein
MSLASLQVWASLVMTRVLPVTIRHNQTMRVVESACTRRRWERGGSNTAHPRDLASEPDFPGEFECDTSKPIQTGGRKSHPKLRPKMNVASGLRAGQPLVGLPRICLRQISHSGKRKEPSIGFQGPEGHGEKIWIWSHRRTDQTVYTLRDRLNVSDWTSVSFSPAVVLFPALTSGCRTTTT